VNFSVGAVLKRWPMHARLKSRKNKLWLSWGILYQLFTHSGLGALLQMVTTVKVSSPAGEQKYEDLIYIRQILGELRGMADRHQIQMLCYLIDMAYQETSETLQAEHRQSIIYTQ
jgi:hypothetical protein